MIIKNIMSEDPVCIDKDQNVCDALRLMGKKNVSRLLVINTNSEHERELVGIVTEKDIAIKLGSSRYGNMAPSHFHVSTVMTGELITADPDMDAGNAASLMLENNIGSLPVILDGEILGIVTKSDLLDICRGRAYEKYTAGDVMSTEMITVSPQERAVHARRMMIDAGIGRLLVMDGGELAGILTAKDMTRAVINFRKVVPDKHKSSRIRNLLVEDIMKQNVRTVEADTPVTDLASMMMETGYGGFPVVDGELEGIVTKTDILDLIVEIEGVF
ncbi:MULTISPECIES: CBS domain-containing protein [Methanothermobacter]|jgi:CBS domain-containing protein|uniref:CBS domain-containing protein n=1 Tax=Methanothermobacter TaxID=145260 RepID=UPI0011C9AEE2|nr:MULTISPECIES: CBS domain-containing protein [unclassified Methanothermobacter]QEF94646.1 CBS domain-containing protein [Methanothermobacter sp. KEPCO-1]QHN07788.1 CBS domain-containing protein [Methanothermobacter sp. THM-2]